MKDDVEIQLCAHVIAPEPLEASWHLEFLPPLAPPYKGGGVQIYVVRTTHANS